MSKTKPLTKPDEIEMKPNPNTEQDKLEEEQGIPKYFSQVELTDEQETRLVEGIKDEYEAIKQERMEEGLDEKWDGLDDQYDGIIEEHEDRQFNLHVHTTKVKVSGIAGDMVAAAFGVDPKYSISPRPGDANKGLEETAEKQEDFLDYKMDEVIPVESALKKVAKSAVLKGTGWKKWSHEIRREKRKREEVYEGNPEFEDDGVTPIVNPQTGFQKNQGLEDFVRNYPDPSKVKGNYKGYIKRLNEGGKINLIVDYTETTYNDPLPTYVDIKNLYVRLGTQGYEGMKTTKLILERQEFTWWELKKKEKEPNGFHNVDRLKYKGKEKEDKKESKTSKKHERFENKTYVIWECTYYFEETEGEDPVKLVCWIGEEREVVIGAIYYPLYALDCIYVPHYIKEENNGIYQPGVGEDLTDFNIAEDAILNFTLEGAWTDNTITPIAPANSDVTKQLLEGRWAHGIPLEAKPGEVDFLNKPHFDSGGMIGLLSFLMKGDDDVSGLSALSTGRESPLDPTAPATKTLALLNQSSKKIKEYLNVFKNGLNISANIVLQMYAQMSQEGRDYKIKPERVTGDNPFGVLSRAEMAARTNIQSRIMAFDFDKMNEKKEDFALYSIVRQEPLIARNPQAVHAMLKTIVKGWSPKWKHKVDEILPSLPELQQQQVQLAMQALSLFIQQQSAKAEATGQPMQLPADKLMELNAQLQAGLVNATPEEQDATKK